MPGRHMRNARSKPPLTVHICTHNHQSKPKPTHTPHWPCTVWRPRNSSSGLGRMCTTTTPSCVPRHGSWPSPTASRSRCSFGGGSWRLKGWASRCARCLGVLQSRHCWQPLVWCGLGWGCTGGWMHGGRMMGPSTQSPPPTAPVDRPGNAAECALASAFPLRKTRQTAWPGTNPHSRVHTHAQRIIADLAAVAAVESAPSLQGRTLTMLLGPRRQ
jgi:hypothetical protein